MTSTLHDCSLSLQQAVNSATRAVNDESTTLQLTQLSGSLKILLAAVRNVREINKLIRNHLDPSSSPVDTSAIDNVVKSMWLQFRQNNFISDPGHDPRGLATNIEQIGLNSGQIPWERFRDQELDNIDLTLVLPNEEMLRMIDPLLRIPATTSIIKTALENQISKSFETLWKSSGETENLFVQEQIKTLRERIQRYSSAVDPVLAAVAVLPKTVKNILESALSRSGAILSTLDQPEMAAWLKNNPGAKDLLVVRFRDN